jgi:nicotinamidase-related amidase
MSLFQKAVKSESKLRMAISGPSGSGKTYTSLAIATALANGGPIAVVDTEHGSASKYADIFAFDVANMHAPFHPDKFIAALHDAEQAGYAVIILDSISHAWSGTGGVLDIVDEAAKRSKSGNTYMAWKEGTPVQNQLVDAIVQSGIHVIATMRSKTEYVLVDTGNGKQAPRKMGMAPVQRDQFEYEFDVVLDMDVDNNAIVTKTRCPALTGKVFPKPGADVADILRSWLAGAPAPEPRPAKAAKPVATPQPPQPTAPPTEAIEQTG